MNNLEQCLEELETRVKALEEGLIETVRTTTVRDPENRVNLIEFLSQKNLDDDVKRTLAVAYWLSDFEKIDCFNTSDIEKYFRLARYAIPKNINDKINMNVKNKHMTPLKEKKDGKKAWYVTNVGANFVENKLNKI